MRIDILHSNNVLPSKMAVLKQYACQDIIHDDAGSLDTTTAFTERHIAIERLPDELLLHILLQPVIDLKTLCAMTRTTPRLRFLVMGILRTYKLPHISFATATEQEGRCKATVQYVFDSLDERTLCARFVPLKSAPKRYRHDTTAAVPILRHMLLSDDGLAFPSCVEQEDRRPKRQGSWITVDSQDSGEGVKSEKSSHAEESRPVKRSSNRRVLPIKSTGAHEIHSNQRLPTVNGSSCPAWQMMYYVSADGSAPPADAVGTHASLLPQNKRGASHGERYLTPLCLTIHLSLMYQSAKKKRSPPHSWSMQAMRWVKSTFL
ncbi:hypothetical protein BCR43DRAFT_497534 [Syncephalastrum racemosum]|uniref:F-box domain-containing protein n=1 Tax=Syncephalastrum racemosum TaxID=13706 RepID=A0A1X2H2J4_SYNRA|nr:hypothetical protein BCR43DRAFT_497534 [Syncephalastrum racemosum]